jgi:hypothetical protein
VSSVVWVSTLHLNHFWLPSREYIATFRNRMPSGGWDFFLFCFTEYSCIYGWQPYLLTEYLWGIFIRYYYPYSQIQVHPSTPRPLKSTLEGTYESVSWLLSLPQLLLCSWLLERPCRRRTHVSDPQLCQTRTIAEPEILAWLSRVTRNTYASSSNGACRCGWNCDVEVSIVCR